jgi:hypothetical protein
MAARCLLSEAGVNAIVDALSVLDIRHIDTRCTPYRVGRRSCTYSKRTREGSTSTAVVIGDLSKGAPKG